MAIDRRELLCLMGATAAVAACPQVGRAETYPSRPVRILVGYAPGGGVDIAARLIGQWLSERLQQQFVVENRTGAATNIATEAVVRSPPDGYTLLLVNAANAINATYYESLSFNFMRDIAPVAGIGRFPYFMAVNPAFPANNVREFIAYAKANPRKVNMGTGGAGGPDHASGELLQLMTGIQMTHVPYRGTTPALTDLLSGQVQMVFCTIPSAIQYVKAGTLRAIAVTSATRLESMPEIPTVGETVPGFEIGSVVRRRCADRYARRDHRDAQQGDQSRTRRSQDQGADRRPRRHSVVDVARGVRQLSGQRNRKDGHGDQGCRHQREIKSGGRRSGQLGGPERYGDKPSTA